MALPNVGLSRLAVSVPNPNAQSFFINYYVSWILTWPIGGNGPYSQELYGSTVIVSDMSQGAAAMQTDVINQMLTFLNARYGVTFGGGQVSFLP